MFNNDDFGECECGKKAYTTVEGVPLCSFHYIEQEDNECLKELISQEIDEKGKIVLPKEIQSEIKKQKPKLYSSFEYYFDV